MALRNSATGYGYVAQALHWSIAVLVVVQFVLANRADGLPIGVEKFATLAQHKSFGITILVLALIRLVWRLTDPPPPLPSTVGPVTRRIALTTHWAFYALLFALPLTGWAQSSAANFPVSWFGLFQLPDFVPVDKALFEQVHEVHEALAATLFFLAILHVVAGLKHQFYDHDGLLRRMLPMRERRR